MKKIKVTKKLLKQLHLYWPKVELVEDKYYKELLKMEKEIAELTGIKNIEIFAPEGEIIGVGNTNRTLRLIDRHEIEENKIDKDCER